MEIKEVLNLNNSLYSVNKIDSFLQEKNVNSIDYALSISKISDIIFNLGDLSLAYKILFDYLNKTTDEFKPLIYDRLISFYYYQEDYKNVLQMIKKKEKLIPNKKANILLDYINYYQATLNKPKEIEEINNYINLDISEDERLKYLLILCDYYLNIDNRRTFLDKNAALKALALKMKRDSIYNQALYNEALVNQKEGHYEEALKIISSFDKIILDDIFKAKLLVLHLRILVYDLKDYRKASIFESEKEALIDKGDNETILDFCDICIDLYQQLDSQFSVSSYISKKNSLHLVKEKKEVTKKTITPIKLDYVPSFFNKKVEVKEEKKEVKEEVVLPKKKEKIIHVDFKKEQDFLYNFAKMIDEINSHDYSFHEYFRQYFGLLNKLISFTEAYFYLDGLKYHFKKERLYKKDDDLSGTILEKAINDKMDILSKANEYRPIVKNNYLDNEYLFVTKVSLGAVLFLFESEISDENQIYLKYSSIYLNMLMERYHDKNIYLKDLDEVNHFLDKAFLGYKLEIDGQITLSKSLKELFKIDDKLSLANYYDLIDNKDVFRYQENYRQKEDIIYRLKNGLYVKELFDSYNGKTRSILIKCSDELKMTDEVKKDLVVGTYNLVSLKEDLKEYQDLKVSFILFSYQNFQTYLEIYGHEFINDLNIAIGRFFKKDKRFKTYHLDGFKYILVIKDLIDKRSITNFVLELDKALVSFINSINKRVKIEANYSAIRYPHDISNLNVDDIVDNLYFALTEKKITIYTKEIVKEKRFEKELVTHISESIDQNMLRLQYEEIMNYEKKSISYLLPTLNLTNYSVDYNLIKKIILKRKMNDMIERYIIHKGLFELKELHEAKKYYLPFLFSISPCTLEDNFINYITEQLKFFKIPKDAISLYYQGEVTSDVIKLLDMLEKKGFKIVTDNFDILNKIKVSAYIYKHSSYPNLVLKELVELLRTHNIRFIVSNIDSEIDVSTYAVLGVKYYALEFNKRKYELKDLIK